LQNVHFEGKTSLLILTFDLLKFLIFNFKKNKTNSKKQFLNKCLQMTGLFKCKANGHSGNANYEYISYERSTTSEQTMSQLFTSSDFNNPATSTMIESDTQMNTQSTSFASNEISIERHIIENYPILDSEEQATYCYYDNPLEVTRKNRSSNSQSFCNNTLARLNNSTECETIVHNTSPLSELKAYDCSCEFLNSTEINTIRQVHPYVNNIKQISQPCNQIEYQQLSFNNSLNSNSTESSSFNSPVSCSTSLFHKSDIVAPNSTELEHLTAEEEDEEDDFNYICSQNYVATFVDDISVQFADTVKILKDNNDEWLYVQVSDDGRTGFIPRSIVVDFKQFISQLKRNSNLKDLLSQY